MSTNNRKTAHGRRELGWKNGQSESRYNLRSNNKDTNLIEKDLANTNRNDDVKDMHLELDDIGDTLRNWFEDDREDISFSGYDK